MTASFDLVRNQIIFKAARMAGLVEEGEQPTPEMLNTAADNLNMIVKELEVHGRRLWNLEEIPGSLHLPSAIRHNDKLYYAIKNHQADYDNEAGVGKYSELYWYESDPDIPEEDIRDWVLGDRYCSGARFDLPCGTVGVESVDLRDQFVDFPMTLINRFQESEISHKWDTGRPHQVQFIRYPEPHLLFHRIPDGDYAFLVKIVKMPNDITSASGTTGVPQTLLSYLIWELGAWLAEEYGRETEKIVRLRTIGQQKLALALKKQIETSDEPYTTPIF